MLFISNLKPFNVCSGKEYIRIYSQLTVYDMCCGFSILVKKFQCPMFNLQSVFSVSLWTAVDDIERLRSTISFKLYIYVRAYAWDYCQFSWHLLSIAKKNSWTLNRWSKCFTVWATQRTAGRKGERMMDGIPWLNGFVAIRLLISWWKYIHPLLRIKKAANYEIRNVKWLRICWEGWMLNAIVDKTVLLNQPLFD